MNGKVDYYFREGKKITNIKKEFQYSPIYASFYAFKEVADDKLL